MAAITYPRTLPSRPDFKTFGWKPRVMAAVSESSFTLDAQAQLSQGEGWAADLELPPMERDAAEPWISLGLELRGRYGTFLCGPSGKEASPRGSWAGTPVAETGGSPDVNYAGSMVLHLRGFTPGASKVAQIGDFLSLNDGLETRLHKVLAADVNADGTGRADLVIFPRLRAAVPDGTAIVTQKPQGTFRRIDNSPGWDLGEACIVGVTFSIVEALTSPQGIG
jgi:hypothetical protein